MRKHLKYSRLVLEILNFENNVGTLKKKLSKTSISWEDVVKVSSQHYVLTTLYCRLKQKQLLQFIPKDLLIYLEELTSINRNRNKKILEEAREISFLLNKHQINHVFLKGTALLASDNYEDLGERMVGDIDLLIERNNLHKAQSLLIKKDYVSDRLTLGDKHLNKRHLPRLKHSANLAAVEIHKKLLKKEYKAFLIPEEVMRRKRTTFDIPIPSHQDLLDHNILSHQINNFGRQTITYNIKNIYDTTLFHKKYGNRMELNLKFSNFRNYYITTSIIQSKNYFSKSLLDNLKYKLVKIKISNSFINSFYTSFVKILNFISILINRLFLFIFISDYRKDVLKDKKRIFEVLKESITR